MAEKPAPKPDDDDVAARFADLDRPIETSADDLPPVPNVGFERPRPKPLPGEPDYGRAGQGKGMFSGSGARSSGAAYMIGTSLVASIIVGTGFGMLADKFLLHSTGTPWGLIVGFMLGVTAGFVNLVRVANQINKD